ncbi:MAG: hypothetical protein Ct9H300mP6_12620 [Gammaproteobacteria bacterium]|nr:MAG: hypothetical protein Ct9H300mP6_12620 [Gammaproteobacteria bacterium]
MTPCRIGSVRGVEIIERLQKNKASKEDAILLEDLCETLESPFTMCNGRNDAQPNSLYN